MPSTLRFSEVTRELSSPEPDILLNIHDPTMNLALWQRSPDQAILREVAALAPSDFPDRRFDSSVSSLTDDIQTLMRAQQLDPQAFKHLLADLMRLARVFQSTCQTDTFRCRLVTTDRDDCKRFHLDRTSFRLLCTYQGPGTEWLPEHQVNRDAERRGAPNEDIIRFGHPRQFEPFWVGIMRGDPHNRGEGLIHRSPAVENTGIVRLLFCLDT